MDEKLEMDIKDESGNDRISCPKCGFKQGPSEECRRCGVIFRKIIKNDTEKEAVGEKRSKTASDPIIAKVQADAMFYKMGHKGSSVSYARVFKWIRISLLFSILLIVSVSSVITNAYITSWEEPQHVVIYPLNGDGSKEVADYIDLLDKDVFMPVEEFMRYEANEYELGLKDPILIDIGPEIAKLPPDPPEVQNPFYIMLWSLRFRYWSFRNDAYEGQSDIRIFVLYKKARMYTESLEKSLGLKKGLIGLVRSPAGINAEPYTNFIIAHEMLHTFGANDKYDIKTLFPRFPEGFAEPDLDPLYPQTLAEIMGGSIPVSKEIFTQAKSLDQVVIGETTAKEIKWVKDEEGKDN